jgi:hypothetical protein
LLAPSPTSGPIVGLVAVALPVDTEPTRFTWVDDQLLMVGFDPARIDRDTVAWTVRYLHGEHTLVTDGVSL